MPPRVHVHPEATSTYGDLAATLTGHYGLTPDDWQQLVIDDWLAVGPDGRWAALNCGLSCPRQNGKNAVLEMRELFGMLGRGEKILHTAHQVKTAQKHFRRLKMFFGKKVNDPTAPFPELNAKVIELRNVNGQEAIYLDNGASVEIVARSQGSGRGYTVDTIVCDESQDMSDDDLEAILSTSSSSPLQNPQWIFTGTPPGPRANGEVFTRTRAGAFQDPPQARLSWLEWSCEKGVDLDDEAEWKKANPSPRLQLEVMRGERSTFSEGGFKRERLGIWEDTSATHQVIPADIWEALTDAGPPDGTPPSSLAVDASHDRLMVVAACWAGEEGTTHVEVLELGYVLDNTTAVKWLVKKARPRIPVVIDALSPAASLVSQLKAARVNVIQTHAGEMAKACGLFFDDCQAGRLTHPAQAMLTDSLAGAKKRRIGEAGGWGWDRKDPTVNIAPLVAVTLARYGASTQRPKTSSTRPSGGRRAVLL